MTVELTPEMEVIVSARLTSGRNSSARGVLEEAFSALQSQEGVTDSQTPGVAAHRATYAPLTQDERQERVRNMEDLFALIDAEGPFEDLGIDRHNAPPDQREPWLT